MEDTAYNGCSGLTAVIDKEVSCKEQQDTSDSASCSSDTPLLPAPPSIEKNLECSLIAPVVDPKDEKWSSETPLLPAETTLTGKENEYSVRCYVPSETAHEALHVTDQPPSMFGVNDKFELAGVQLLVTVVDVSCVPQDSISNHPAPTEFSLPSDASNMTHAPINIYGSGWEFGSVCSMNLPSENDSRSRKSTMDGHLFHNPSSFGAQQRILSKIFKDKIGSMEFRGSGKDLSSCFMEPVQEVYDDKRINNMKNLLVLSLGVTLLHIATFGLRNLQSSLNSENGLGVYSLATLCGAFMIGSLISRFVVQKFRPKICLSFAIFCHLVYIIANYFSSFYTIIPASLIQGVGSALLWNGLCTYITEIGLNEASIKNKSTNAVLSRYFGIFFLILQFSMVLGNLLSSIILSQTSDFIDGSQLTTSSNHSVVYSTESYQLTVNSSSGVNSSVSEHVSSLPSCGAAYCDLAARETAKPTITDMQKLTIILTYSGCAIFAIIVIQAFLDQLPNYISRSPSMKVVIKQITSVLGMVFDRQFCFIVMLCLYTVIGNGFVVADVLKIFITCPLGMKMVGYSMICFGVMGSISSYIFGKLAKCTGNILAFLTAAILNVVSLALMVKWEPTADDQYLLFAFVGVWGFADGIWQSQINSVISSVFSDCYENAFSCCRFLQGVAGLFFFNMSNMFCLTTKIFFTMVTCIMSVCLYVVMEIISKRESVKEIEIEVEGSGQTLKKQ